MKYSVVSRLNSPLPHVAFDFTAAVKELEMNDARRGEDYAFGFVLVSDIGGEVKLEFGSLGAVAGEKGICSCAYECINFGGVDVSGKPFEKKIIADAGEQVILWSTLRIPDDADGEYSGKITLSVGEEKVTVPVSLTVAGEVAEHGWDEPAKLTRLRWLNSTLEQNGKITAPYTEPVLEGNTVGILGRSFEFGTQALPVSVNSFFNKNIKVDGVKRVISDGLKFIVKYADGTVSDSASFTAVTPLGFEKTNDGYTASALSTDGKINLEIKTGAEYDGYAAVSVFVTALEDVAVDDISLVCGLNKGYDTYSIGMGLKGGYSPDDYTFVWDSNKHQNSIWVGGINGGIRLEYKGGNFIEPLVNIYYRHRPLNIPDSYGNPDENGKPRGYVRFLKGENGSTITASSGARTIAKGETLDFRFDMLVTPLKEYNLKARITTRYYHSTNVEEAERINATHVIWHHANEINPYINYPFLTPDKIKNAVASAHERGMGAKFYYTVREQSDKTCEMNAFLTLGEEIFPTPVGGQGSILWSSEELKGFRARFGDDYIPAWQTQYDMAVITDGHSRLCNYYVEGLNRMVKEYGIDGIYVDDVAYGRDTIRRARRVLDADGRDKAEGIGIGAPRKIDLHSWNHYCDLAGYGNSLNLYMTLLPYIDSVWIGEGFGHMQASPDFWLTEITGTPYGCVGEMLLNSAADNNAKYRGMLFGITTRQPWNGQRPMGVWKFFEEYDFKDRELCGFWNDESPLSTGDDRIKGSIFTGENDTVIALASWADEPVTIKPTLGGKALEGAYIPAIDDFQDETAFDGNVTIEPGCGVVIVVK